MTRASVRARMAGWKLKLIPICIEQEVVKRGPVELGYFLTEAGRDQHDL